MCCSGGKVAATDQALQDAQAKAATTYNADASLAFGEQQSVLAAQRAKLEHIVANPMGYTPQQLHTATTSINESTATAAKQAIGAAAAYAAAHGSADIGGGATGQIAGEIGSAAAQSKAQQLAELSRQSETQKQQNLWAGLSGLQSVGSEYGGATGTTIGGAGESAGSAVNAGSGVTAAKYAGMEAFGSILSGVGGLAQAGVKAFKG